MACILITGGAGFIGNNFVHLFAAAHPDWKIVDLDALTYAAHRDAFAAQAQLGNVTPVQGDICDEELVARLFADHHITGVIHFAAESHVDNSIAHPLRFVQTNVVGTSVLLEAARRYWQHSGTFATSRFHHISTDEVYGSLGATGRFTEESPLAPNSPYSASKASSDLMVRSYRHTYGMNCTMSNCSNNYGSWQHAEKLIPTVIRKCLAGEPIPVYGTGTNVRDWIWVGDHCRAVDLIFNQAQPGANYNVGSTNEWRNLDIVHTICEILDAKRPSKQGRYQDLITMVTDRPGHDFRYAIDSSKIQKELGWQPQMSFKDGLAATIDWYLGAEGTKVLHSIKKP